MRASRLFLASLAASTVLAAPAQAARVLAPHRAVYDLSLKDASDRSGITGLSGRMVYEFNGSACEGYTVTFRFVSRIQTQDASRMSDQQTTTFEEGDGKLFSFVTKSYMDQELEKEVRGTATRDDKGLNVELTRPDIEEIELQSTQFPTQHLMQLIDKANAGETFYETTLFDGSEDANEVMTTTIVVGKPVAPAGNDPELPKLQSLSKDRFWPVDIAYFGKPDDETEPGEELPQYRISFKLHENGLTRDLVMDYGDFSMTGKLVDLSLFEPAKPCSN
ncbi:MAG TPA: cell envelope integrity EipB family protein [Rhizobiaceae bacterium]|nr:cell envelope integrity EipB family protein [Rhizobiaceae bacterium]